ETAFDRVRKGQSQANAALIQVALDAKDHIHVLIEDPDTRAEGGDEILANLRAIVEGTADEVAPAPTSPATVKTAPAAAEVKKWRLVFYLPGDALIYGTN